MTIPGLSAYSCMQVVVPCCKLCKSSRMCNFCDLCVMQDLSPYQQAHKLVQMPSLLEWLSFVFASGNLLAGPYFELADYLNFIQKKGPWDPRSKQPSDASQYRAGVSYVPIVFTCENSLIWARCTIWLMFSILCVTGPAICEGTCLPGCPLLLHSIPAD